MDHQIATQNGLFAIRNNNEIELKRAIENKASLNVIINEIIFNRRYNLLNVIFDYTDNDFLNSINVLHLAVGQGDNTFVEMLVDKGLDINKQNFTRDTPLHVAVRKGNKNTVEYLLINGAYTDIKNGEGFTPEELANFYKNYQIAELIQDYTYMDIKEPDSDY